MTVVGGLTIILTHNYADFDALAALVAAAKLYPGSHALAPEKIQPDAARFIEEYGDQLPVKIDAGVEEHSSAKIAVIVDGRRRSSIGLFLPLVEKAREVHIYDHHPPSPDDLEGSEIRVEPVGAVTTLLLEEIRQRRIVMSELENTLMLLGIYRDTASLTGAGTTSRDAAAAAYLWEQGINLDLFQEYLQAPPAEAREHLLVKLLESSELFEICERRILLTTVQAEEQIGGMGALIRRLQQIEEIDLALIIVALPGGAFYLDARTAADDLDLPLLLAPLGARGHRRAVTTETKTEEIAAFKEQLLELLERYLPPFATAIQIATTPVAAAADAWSVARAGEYLESEGYSACPVLEEGKVAGMITRRELQKALRSGFGDTPVQEFMRRHPVTAGPQESVTALRRAFVEKKTGQIVVAGDEGEPLGMVTPIDILRYLYRLDRRLCSPASRGSLVKAENNPAPTAIDNLDALIRKRFPSLWQSRLLLMGQRAALAGASIYLVGGAIRDLLLGAALSKDLDFVVIPDAAAFAGEMVRFLGGKLKVFEQFGTASIFLEEGLRLDLATARQELYASPAALPQVESTESLKSDLYRRDFTVNTLACSILPQSFGQLYDFFNGREDLSRGVIRTLYHLSFADDPLRLLRAVRFEQRFGFSIEENTLALIEKALRSRVLDKVSRRRLAREISLIYEEDDPAAVLMRLQELGILEFIYPRLVPDHETWQRLNRISETLAWAELREWRSPPEKELVYLCGLLLGMDQQDRQAILRRLGLSRERAGAVLQGCREVPPLLEELSGEGGAGLRPSTLVNRLDPLSPEALLLLYALARNRNLQDNVRLYLESLQHVRPRLRGGALKELGLQPGPLFGEILSALRQAVLDGELRSYDEELEFVESYLERRREE